MAHAATFIAALVAAFEFMSRFRWTETWPKCARSLAGRILCWLIGGGLLSMAVYVLFRMMWYGQLVVAIRSSQACEEFSVCYPDVAQAALTNLTQRGGLYWFIVQFSSSYHNVVGMEIAPIFGFLLVALILSLLHPQRGDRDC